MTIAETARPPETPNESPFLFVNPDMFATPEVRRYASNATVAHIAPLWLPLPRDSRTYGGAEDVALNIVNGQDRLNVKHQIVFGHPGNMTLAQSVNAEVHAPPGIKPSENLLEVLRTDPARAVKLESAYVASAYRFIAENQDRISVVHDHTNFGRRLGRTASEFLPVVRTEHGNLLNEKNILSEFNGQKNVGFVAISHDQRSQMPELNWLGVNHNGVEIRDFDFTKQKDDYLLFLGRVCKEKGVHNAIAVAKELGKTLIIAGDVETKPDSVAYFKREVEPSIDNRQIIHIGGVNAKDRRGLLSSAQALLMLNEWREPFGMVMAEALASGTPVVGYDAGSIPEVVRGRTGFVVSSIDEAVSAVERISDGDYSPEQCRRLAEEFFSAEAMTARYFEMYIKANGRFNENRQRSGYFVPELSHITPNNLNHLAT